MATVYSFKNKQTKPNNQEKKMPDTYSRPRILSWKVNKMNMMDDSLVASCVFRKYLDFTMAIFRMCTERK